MYFVLVTAENSKGVSRPVSRAESLPGKSSLELEALFCYLDWEHLLFASSGQLKFSIIKELLKEKFSRLVEPAERLKTRKDVCLLLK